LAGRAPAEPSKTVRVLIKLLAAQKHSVDHTAVIVRQIIAANSLRCTQPAATPNGPKTPGFLRYWLYYGAVRQSAPFRPFTAVTSAASRP